MFYLVLDVEIDLSLLYLTSSSIKELLSINADNNVNNKTNYAGIKTTFGKIVVILRVSVYWADK